MATKKPWDGWGFGSLETNDAILGMFLREVCTTTPRSHLRLKGRDVEARLTHGRQESADKIVFAIHAERMVFGRFRWMLRKPEMRI